MSTLSIPFRFENGTVQSVDDIETIVKQQVINYLVTNNAERPMLVNYGGNIRRLMFELNDPLFFADFITDVIPDINATLSKGTVLGIEMVSNETDSQFADYDNSTMTLKVRYAISPQYTSSFKFIIDTIITEESAF